MKTFAVTLAAFATQAFATEHRYRMNHEIPLSQGSATNHLDYLIYIKNNAIDENIHELHSELVLDLSRRPSENSNVYLGMYFGERKEYVPEEHAEGEHTAEAAEETDER